MGHKNSLSIAMFGSGSGTIIRAMLAAEKASKQLYGSSPFSIRLLFTDRVCHLQTIAQEENLPLIVHPRVNASRIDHDKQGLALLLQQQKEIDLLVLAGYMRLITTPWLEAFPNRILNVHPADLTILDPMGQRKWVGCQAVQDALMGGSRETRSSVIFVDAGVDSGLVFVSGPRVSYQGSFPITEQEAAKHQERQKQESDWPACLTALQLLAERRAEIKGHTLWIDGQPQGTAGFTNVTAAFQIKEGNICVESLGSLANSPCKS